MASGIMLYATREACRILRVDGRQFQRLLALAHIQTQPHAYDHRVRTITHEQLQILASLRDQVVGTPGPDEVAQLQATVDTLSARLAALEARRPTATPPAQSGASPAVAITLPEGWVPARRYLRDVLQLNDSKVQRWLVQYAHLREHGWWANGVEYALTPEQQTAFRRLAEVSDTASGGRENRQAR